MGNMTCMCTNFSKLEKKLAGVDTLDKTFKSERLALALRGTYVRMDEAVVI